MANDAVLQLAADKNKMEWPAQHSGWSKAFEVFCKTVFKTYCPLRTLGQENLPKEPYLLCSNHASHIDSAALMVAAGLSFQKTGLIAAKDYFFDVTKRHFIHYLMNLVPIARGIGTKAVRDSIESSRLFLLSGGLALIIYPEGTRSVSGKLSRFKEGASILAHDLDLPMVPAYVSGSFLSLPKGSYFLRPKRVTVRFGKPLKVSEFINDSELENRKVTFQAYRDATAELERRVHALEQESFSDA